MAREDVAPGAGRRRNAERTKAIILAAATELFAARGYARTGLRDVASAAGVAVSLLPQHFGSKAALFEAALVDAMAQSRALDGPKSEWGRAMVEHVTGAGDVRLPSMVILSTGDDNAREITARVIRERLVPMLADRLGQPDATARAMRIVMLSTGFLIYARQLPIGAVDEQTKRFFADTLQAAIEGS